MKIQQSIPLVTGANRGIGRAIVQAYLEAGVKKIYAAARKKADLDTIVAADPSRVVPIVLDITKSDQIAAAAASARDVNVLINNAGVLSAGTSFDDLRRDMEVNYFGTLALTRAIAPVLAANGGGVVANLLSVVSLVSAPGLAGYCASKAAIWSATQALRAQLKSQKTRVVGVFPGPIDTDMAKDLNLPKVSAAECAKEIVDGIAAGAEDIFPDPMAKNVYAGWKTDHKAVELQFASM